MRKILCAIAIGGALFISCNSNNTSNKQQKMELAKSNATEKYVCPMNCEGDTAYAAAGLCPVCEMDLEQVIIEK